MVYVRHRFITISKAIVKRHLLVRLNVSMCVYNKHVFFINNVFVCINMIYISVITDYTPLRCIKTSIKTLV